MKSLIEVKIFTLSLLIASFSLVAIAHEDEHKEKAKTAVETTTFSPVLFEDINRDYTAEIKPIFQSKCFDCHSDQTKYPWYYKVPIVKQIMDHHIEEGREHLDMSADFPFHGHGDPMKRLKHIRKEIEENEMPPLYYKIAHSGASFTDAEKEKVFKWIDQSLEKLNQFSGQ